MSAPAAVHRFQACEFRVWPEQQYAETLWPDGARCGATRECELSNRAYAEHLGYTECWTAMVEHEIGHTLVSERMGHPFSPTLRAVALKNAPGTAPYEEILAEEALVLALQRFMCRGDVLPILWHPDVEPHFREWAREIRHLTTQLIGGRDESPT